MPSNFVINTQSTVKYNNNLKKATGNMKLGVNSDVNVDLKNVGVRNMDGGSSKNNRSTLHTSNQENGKTKKQKKIRKRVKTKKKENQIKTPEESTIRVTKLSNLASSLQHHSEHLPFIGFFVESNPMD